MSIIQQFCISYLWFSIRKSNDILVPMKMLEIKYFFLLDLLHNYNRSDEASFCLQISKDMNVERCRSWEGMEHIINDLVIYNMTLVKTIVNTSVKVFPIVFWHRGEETKHRHTSASPKLYFPIIFRLLLDFSENLSLQGPGSAPQKGYFIKKTAHCYL